MDRWDHLGWPRPQVAVVSGSGVGVVFDGWAPSGLLQYALDDINTMVDRAEVA